MYIASCEGHVKLVKILIEHGADVNGICTDVLGRQVRVGYG